MTAPSTSCGRKPGANDRGDCRAEKLDRAFHRPMLQGGRTHLEGNAGHSPENLAGIEHLGCDGLGVANQEGARRSAHCLELLACGGRPPALASDLCEHMRPAWKK